MPAPRLRHFRALLIFSVTDAVKKRLLTKTFEKQFFFHFLQPALPCFYFFHHFREFHEFGA